MTAAKRQARKAPRHPAGDEHLRRVRGICAALPETTEKLSHGEPTFFVKKQCYCMFANNHHDDGHVAVWIAAPLGLQAVLVQSEPRKYFRPPYVGVGGWIGIELTNVSDDELTGHLLESWRIIHEKQQGAKPKPRRTTPAPRSRR